MPEVERAHTTVLEVGDYQIDLRSNVAAHVAVIDKGSPGNPGPATPVLVCDSVSLDEGFGFDDCAGEATHGGEYRVEVSADAASLSYDLTVTQFGSVKGSWPNQTIEAPASQPAGN